MIEYLIYMIPGLLLGMWASYRLRSTYGHYMQVPAASGLSGAQAAREILDNAGLHNMPIHETPGHLTDHYDPIKKALFLSKENFHGRSIAALGVSAHEAGHALQHKAAYAPLHVRMAIVPITNIATNAVYFLLILGMILAATKLIWAAVIAFGVIVFFHLVTLPVEYDASRRAKQEIYKLGLVSRDEQQGVGKVLSAAALTYVAALVTSVMTFLYYLSIVRGGSRH